ncbi:uncharacterized protein LOC143341396 [Colletes latitarsis]|uniref:uncharacterized protein LOC143341396 n=1 Tax=Colletes latitarsis TaxID=2605962 RepID=UPI004036E63D
MGRFRDLIFPQGGCKLISSFPVLAATLFAFLLLPRCSSTSLTRDRLDPDFHPTLDPAQSAHVLSRITIHGFEECQPFQPEVLLYKKRRRQRQGGPGSMRKLEKTSFAEKQRIADLPDETARNEQIREELSEIVRNPWIQSSTCEHFALRSHVCGGQPKGRGPAIVGRGFESSKEAPHRAPVDRTRYSCSIGRGSFENSSRPSFQFRRSPRKR